MYNRKYTAYLHGVARNKAKLNELKAFVGGEGTGIAQFARESDSLAIL